MTDSDNKAINKEKLDGLEKLYLYISISVSGASILAIEILGTRILGPFYGVSIYLWSALITVTLAALSLGYALGGQIADRKHSIGNLASIIMASGIWLLIVPLIKFKILHILEPIGLRLAVLIAAIIFFFPALTFLGMVSPYAIRLKTKSISEVGRSAGNLYAISTAASVLAALITGYYLIPNIGILRLTLGIGILLIITGSLGLFMKKETSTKSLLSMIIIIITAISYGIIMGRTSNKSGGRTLKVVQSPYGEIRVLDRNDQRFLLIDGAIHSEIDSADFETNSAYVNTIDITKSFFDKTGKMLLIGLGGGCIAKRFAKTGWKVDAVEIDGKVVEIAKRYFGLKPIDAELYQMDGRRYLETCRKRYDLIVIDAFGSSYIPFQLVTKEAFALAASHLKPEGLIAINVITLGWRSKVVLSISASLKENLKNVAVLPIVEPPNKLGNVIIIASNRKLELGNREPPIPESRFSGDYDRFHAWENRFEPDVNTSTVLTDDLNPIDIWAEKVNLENRRELHAYFGRDYIN